MMTKTGKPDANPRPKITKGVRVISRDGELPIKVKMKGAKIVRRD